MAFVDDPNQNTENVAGAAPLSQPTATPQDQGESANTQGDSSPSTIQSGSTAPKTTNKSGKASSGMFTNIQNYVAKNKPQGQKMAENTLGEIRKANESSKEAQKNALSQFSSQTEQGGLHDTAARTAELDAYTRSQANIVTPPPEAVPQDGTQAEVAPVETVPQTGIDESQFANILNAKYQGPRNLTETGNIYSQLQNQATKSADMGKLTQTAEGRGQLLKDINTRGGRQYGAGMSKLDSMLVGQQPNQIEALMKEGSDIGTSQDIMGRLSQQSKDVAGQRASEVQDTRDASRKAFGTVASERQQEVDARVDDVVANWDNLPAHFRESFSNPDGTVNLSKLEAVTLGINQGEGVYNLSGEDLFGSADNSIVQSERDRLISQNEQGNLARLQALSNLATGMGDEKLYDITSAGKADYSNIDRAGTQTAMDALDLDHVRSQMASAERGFRTDAAKDVVGTGKGQKTYNKGFMKGSGKKHSTRTSTANVKDMLDQAGYDFNSEVSDTNIGTKDILNNLASAIQDTRKNSTFGDLGQGSVTQGGSGAGANSMVQDYGFNPMSDWNSTLQDAFGGLEDSGREIGGMGGDAIATVGDIGKDVYGTASKAVKDIGKFWGGGGSDAQSAANQIAQNAANTNLQKNMEQKIKDLNYTRRSNIIEGEDADLRNQALMDILAKMDTTNN
tara:strand:+ start:449 stop:2482 length:2034 start_codon:yes stop_codon:yes gene_type:complete